MEIVILLATFAVIVLAGSALSRRLGLPAPLLLLAVGIVGSFLPFVEAPELPPELVLVGLLPPLLYATAVNTSLLDFRANARPIGLLSVGLVIFTTVGIGFLSIQLIPIPLAAGLALGAIVAPPDAVAATAIGRQIGLPRRVVTILEGESLVNDATALVALRTAVAAFATTITALAIALDFAKAVVLAVVIGWIVAKLATLVLRRITDSVTNTVLSFIVPFAAYAPTELLHASGVLAVVVAGLLLGHKAPVVQTARARLNQRVNWATVQFMLENSVFLLVGLQVRRILGDVGDSGVSPARIVGFCAAVLGAVILLRIVWLGLTRLLLRPSRRDGGKHDLSWRETVVVGWAGMRGVVTLAAALTLPATTPLRDVLILAALVVTVGTLLLQGLTLPVLARWLRVRGPDPREDALQEAVVYQKAAAAGDRRATEEAGPGSEDALERVRATYAFRTNALWERLGRHEVGMEPPSVSYRRLRLAALQAEREEVLRIRHEGRVDQEVIQTVLNAQDIEESMLTVVTERLDTTGPHPRGLSPQVHEALCPHLAAAPTTVASDDMDGCRACEAEGGTWVHLRMCLTCGEVACCDSSRGRHATRHWEETGHPVIRSVEPGESWRWCYADEVLGA